MNKLATKIPIFTQSLVSKLQPKLNTFVKYAKVELVPPTPAEVVEAGKGFTAIINGARTGTWKQLTVKEGWLNTLVAIEVICWFFVGECIGKRSVIGYQV